MLLLWAPELPGQGCCSGGVPVSGNLGLPAGTGGLWQFQLSLDHNYLDALLTGTEVLDDATRQRTTSSLLLEASYGLSDRWTLSGLVSGVRQTRTISGPNGSTDFTAHSGLGDAIFLVRYNFLGDSTHPNSDLVLGTGPKFPLGRSDVRGSNGIVLPADLQPGTGSWDAMLWGLVRHSGWIRPTMTFLAIPSLRLAGTNRRFNGSQLYRFGHEFQVNAGVSDRVVTRWAMVDPFVMLRWRSTTPDEAERLPVSNTGGHWLHLLPGVTVSPRPNLNVRLNGEVPVFRQLTGTQLTTSYRLTASVYISIPTSSRISPTPIP